MKSNWADLRSRFEQADVPLQHRELLAKRRKEVESGGAELLSWDEVKGRLGRKDMGREGEAGSGD